MDKAQIAVILTMIIGFTYFGMDNVDPSHYCLEREIKASCQSLSDSLKTCYTLPSKTGGKVCYEGWKEIPFILSEVNVPSGGHTGKSYLCDPSNGGCRIK